MTPSLSVFKQLVGDREGAESSSVCAACHKETAVVCPSREGYDSSPYQTCNSTPVSGFQSSATTQHGSRNHITDTQIHTKAP